MPGQEKFVYEYYQKNPSATQHIQSLIFEEKVIKFIKSKSSLIKKELSIKEAEKIITNFNDSKKSKISVQDKEQESKSKKSKKLAKSKQ